LLEIEAGTALACGAIAKDWMFILECATPIFTGVVPAQKNEE
jgi:hypothetical protein